MALRVMILDDDELIRSTLTLYLRQEGHEVLSFSRPDNCPVYYNDECSCQASKACTDVIITDLNMPGQNGLGFIEDQISKGCRVSHIAVMSGDWESTDLKKAEEIGCQIFHKPFSIIHLKNWIDNLQQKKAGVSGCHTPIHSLKSKQKSDKHRTIRNRKGKMPV